MANTERPFLSITLGESFTVKPSVDSVLDRYDYGNVTDRIYFELEGIGKGHLRFIEMQPGFNDIYPVLFPAGGTLPFTIEGTIENLSQEQADHLSFFISYGLKEYEGVPEYDEDSEDLSDLDFYSYWNPDDEDEECNILFPREALNLIYFTFR